MSGSHLPPNFVDNPKALFKRVQPRVIPPQVFLSTSAPVIPASSSSKQMAAEKTLCKFAAPSADNVLVGPRVNMGDVDFDLKSSLIIMAQASPFCGKPNEDANAHLQ